MDSRLIFGCTRSDFVLLQFQFRFKLDGIYLQRISVLSVICKQVQGKSEPECDPQEAKACILLNKFHFPGSCPILLRNKEDLYTVGEPVVADCWTPEAGDIWASDAIATCGLGRFVGPSSPASSVQKPETDFALVSGIARWLCINTLRTVAASFFPGC